MKILAVDPGGVTGFALFEDGQHDSRHQEGYEDAVTMIRNLCEDGLDALIVEGFTIRQGSHKLDPVAFDQTTDLIGACRLLALEHGIPFIRQYPKDKAFGTNDKLKRLHWYKGAPGHADDASRHILHYLVTHNYTPILEALTKET